MGLLIYRLRGIVEGTAWGVLLVINDYISFLGDVDPGEGVMRKKGYEGVSVRNKILVFKGSRGSTVGSYVIYSMARAGKAPSALVVEDVDQVLISGCILGGIVLGRLETRISGELEGLSGAEARVSVSGTSGILEVLQATAGSYPPRALQGERAPRASEGPCSSAC